VLNVARGGIVDEAAVAAALESGHLAARDRRLRGRATTDSPLLEAPNTLLTPHLGASTAEAQVLVAEESRGAGPRRARRAGVPDTR
jgi:D-3-phosphoglycerate dehydrogenase